MNTAKGITEIFIKILGFLLGAGAILVLVTALLFACGFPPAVDFVDGLKNEQVQEQPETSTDDETTDELLPGDPLPSPNPDLGILEPTARINFATNSIILEV